MNTVLDRLNLQAQERRLLFVFLVVLFIVLNRFFVWPHFSKLKETRNEISNAQQTLNLYQIATNQTPTLLSTLEELGESAGPQEPDTAAQRSRISRIIDRLASDTGLTIVSRSGSRELRPEPGKTNLFFTELEIPMEFRGTEAQLVDFMYQLGEEKSLFRVHNLSLTPSRVGGLALDARISLVASFVKDNVSTNSVAGAN